MNSLSMTKYIDVNNETSFNYVISQNYQSGFEPGLQSLGSHAGENVSNANKRRRQFEAAVDWHVVKDAVVSH